MGSDAAEHRDRGLAPQTLWSTEHMTNKDLIKALRAETLSPLEADLLARLAASVAAWDAHWVNLNKAREILAVPIGGQLVSIETSPRPIA